MTTPPTDGRTTYWQAIPNGMQMLMVRSSTGRWLPTTTIAPASAGWLQLAILARLRG